jgi:hypothetical protein
MHAASTQLAKRAGFAADAAQQRRRASLGMRGRSSSPLQDHHFATLIDTCFTHALHTLIHYQRIGAPFNVFRVFILILKQMSSHQSTYGKVLQST